MTETEIKTITRGNAFEIIAFCLTHYELVHKNTKNVDKFNALANYSLGGLSVGPICFESKVTVAKKSSPQLQNSGISSFFRQKTLEYCVTRVYIFRTLREIGQLVRRQLLQE